MRIDELITPRQNQVYQQLQDSYSMRDFLDRLVMYGFEVEKIGAGFYATVFSRPGSNDVYKLYTAKDTGYTRFLKYVMANQDNPHLPKIKGSPKQIKMPKNKNSLEGKDWILVRMERLDPHTDADPYFGRIKAVIDGLEYDTPDLLARRESAKGANFRYIANNYPDLLKVLVWIVDNNTQISRPDLHDENVMQRGDTVVIIDPYSDL